MMENLDLFQEHMSDHLEGQRQEHAIHHYHNQADDLERWLIRMRNAVICSLELRSQEKADMEDQLDECQVAAPPAVHLKKSILILYLGIFRKKNILELFFPKNVMVFKKKIYKMMHSLNILFKIFKNSIS